MLEELGCEFKVGLNEAALVGVAGVEPEIPFLHDLGVTSTCVNAVVAFYGNH